MNCFFCSADGSHNAAIGVCVDCGCAACERHAAVDAGSTKVRTGNLFQERPLETRRFRCFACHDLIVGRIPAGAAAG